MARHPNILVIVGDDIGMSALLTHSSNN